jgi:predicted molibdopterin-dependent oxidoreductase YjgC
VQRFRGAFPPAGDAAPAAGVLAQLARRLGGTVPSGTAEKLFDEMSAAEPAFGGLAWSKLGFMGAVPQAATPVGAEGR